MKRALLELSLYIIGGCILGIFLALLVAWPANADDMSAKDESLPRIVLTTQNTAVLRGVVNNQSIMSTQLKLIDLVIKRGSKNYPLYLVLDSPGGSIDAGLSFIQFVKPIKNLHTITVFSASMASAIVEALPGERLVTSTGVFMFHRARGGFEGQFESGEVESRLSAAKSLVRYMEVLNSSRMQMSLDTYKGLVKDELWLLGTDSVKYRAADRVVDITCSVDLVKQNTKTVLGGLFGLVSINVEFSGCPLLRTPLKTSGDDYVYLVPNLVNYKMMDVIKKN